MTPNGQAADAPVPASTPVSWRAELRPCPLCGDEAFTTLGRRGGPSHRAALGVESTIVRCRKCHGVYPRPFLMPDRNPYEGYGAEEYFHGKDRAGKIAAGRFLAGQAKEMLGRTGRMLELGCGRGEQLLGAREAGWEVAGVDMTAGFVPADGELSIEIAPVEEAKSLDETYDAILLAAILEHVYDPISFLRRVHDALVPGGIVFIDVPNECSLWTRMGNAYMRLRGRDWAINLSPTFPPFHVVGFCPASLRAALTRTGFSVVTLETPRWNNDLPKSEGLARKVESWGVDVVLGAGAIIGQGAGITCWARRAPANSGR
jgi:SAM-dependent methyltransferase